MSLIQGILRTATSLGLDPRPLASARHFPKLFQQMREFQKAGGVISQWHPIISDYSDDAGTAKGHYFHQDLLVAADIFQRSPKRHVDVGSRVDGFVAHVASFRQIEVFDVRELSVPAHPNIVFRRRDLMSPNVGEQTDSLSCLHTIEHFGLGRYGDPVNVSGHLDGVRNLVDMLLPSGIFYISFPIGLRDEVHFNAHRIFSPESILDWPAVAANLDLIQFSYVDDRGDLHRDVSIQDSVGRSRWGCGIYTFKKKAGRTLA